MSKKSSDPLPTAPNRLPVSVQGFENTDHAKAFASLIAHVVYEISCYIDLDRLDGITVAHDYDKALAHLDRGCPTTRPLTRTSSDQLSGVAMAPPVMRDGVIKGHVVFYAPVVLPIEQEEGNMYRQAIYTIAHECAHVEDLKNRDKCFPGTILRKMTVDVEDATLEQISSALWEEYAACRVSAPFCKEQMQYYEQGFIDVLRKSGDLANEAIRSYRVHGNVKRVLEEAGQPLCEPLRLFAYLSGHLDGLGEDMESAPLARDELLGSGYAAFTGRILKILRSLWSVRGSWASPAAFDPLKAVGKDALGNGGIFLIRQPDGNLYVDIPFTPKTMPA